MIPIDSAEPFFAWLLRATWQASVLVLALLLLQAILRDRLSPRWRYNLWLLVLLRLSLPVLPSSPVSLFNLAPAMTARPVVETFDTTDTIPLAGLTLDGPLHQTSSSPITRAMPRFDWRSALIVIWLIGASALLLRACLASLHLSRRLRRMKPVDDPAVPQLLDRCRRELHIRARIRALTSPNLSVPAIVGLLRPRILLPASLAHSSRLADLRHVLLHELAHVRRHDVLINYLATLLHALHWFNPVLLVAFNRLRAERELACDELVLELTSAEDRRGYGQTLLNLAQFVAEQHPSPGMIGILERRHLLKRRITMIARFTAAPSRRWTLLAIALGALLSCAMLTDAVSGQQEQSPGASPAQPAANPVGAPTSATTPPPEFRSHVAAQVADPFAAPAGSTSAAQSMSFEELIKLDRTPTGAELGAASRRLWEEQFRPKLISKDGAVLNKQQVEIEYRMTFRRWQERLQRRFPDVPFGRRTGEPQSPFDPQVVAVASLTEDAAEQQRNAHVQEALKKVLPEIRFEDAPLSDVVAFLRDVTGLNIALNRRGLEAAGVALTAPVTLQVKEIPLQEALRLILQDVEAEPSTLAIQVSGGVLHITPHSQAGSRMTLKAYDIADLLAVDGTHTNTARSFGGGGGGRAMSEADKLVELVRETVFPAQWRENGGQAGMRSFGTKLIVTADENVHREVAKLLAMLREKPATER